MGGRLRFFLDMALTLCYNSPMDFFTFFISAVIFFVYGVICMVSLIFTFSLDVYHKIDQVLKIDIISTRILTPIERNINVIDDWLMSNNKLVGPVLTLLSLIDLKLSFEIINKL